ncbi:hypothetical protein [Lysinibacillus yapensis]|uniref:hypothetical protein n=1 Tax=Ureibacillus yapensis TaxID=2304605 RepID=UPI001314E6FB|nr:hypothetical protein [Lysinibacillus yapensis]
MNARYPFAGLTNSEAEAPGLAPTDVLCIESGAADTSAGRPESKASFQLSTEGLKRPRGAGAEAGCRNYF